MINKILGSNRSIENSILSAFHDVSSGAYSATTEEITVTIWPEFIGSQNNSVGNLFVWAYHVNINNQSAEPVKLISRHWRIVDEAGFIQKVEGKDVVGKRPLLAPNTSFNYSSGVNLRYPSGIMSGSYGMKKKNGEVFQITIPAFSLDIPNSHQLLN